MVKLRTPGGISGRRRAVRDVPPGLPALREWDDLPRIIDGSEACWSPEDVFQMTYWLVRDYLDELGKPRATTLRDEHAKEAAKLACALMQGERENQELADDLSMSLRKVERHRRNLRAASIRSGKELPAPRPIPGETTNERRKEVDHA